MDKDKLMQPRYLVIADYPNSHFTVGDILTYANSPQEINHYVDVTQYPKIFRKLGWWEMREPDELPEYVVWPNGTSIDKVDRWVRFKHNLFARVHSGGRFEAFTFEPATEEEYLTSINSKEQ